MTSTRTLLRSFAGGEVSPQMFGRLDTAQYQTGAARLQNLIAAPQGLVRRRPGLQFVREVADSSTKVRLFPFTYSTDQTVVVELGVGYARFHTLGATLLYATPDAFQVPQNVTTASSGGLVNGFDAALDEFEFTGAGHGFSAGDPVLFTLAGTGSLPPELVAGTVYFVVLSGVSNPTTRVKLATTQANALAGTAIALSGASAGAAGDRKLHYAYEVGNVAAFGGQHYYCRQLPHDTHVGTPPPNASHWYQLPKDPNIYEAPHGFTEAMLFELTYAQSGDVLTFCHPDGPPYELRRLGAEQWEWRRITFGGTLPAPTGLAVVGTAGAPLFVGSVSVAAPAVWSIVGDHNLYEGDEVWVEGITGTTPAIPDDFYVVSRRVSSTTLNLRNKTTGANIDVSAGAFAGPNGRIRFVPLGATAVVWSQSYKVTALDEHGVESEPSAAVAVTNNLFESGSFNTISWNAVPGAARYRVYKQLDGLYGFIAETETASLVDDRIDPELGITPPIQDQALSGTDYPGAVGYFEGRRVFAGSPQQPQNVWLTRTGTEADLSYHLPLQPDDRISRRIDSHEASTIRHVVALDHLLLLTSSAEFRVSPVNTDALTPDSFGARPQSYVGASLVRPQVVDNVVVYCAARGGHVRQLGYQAIAQAFVPGDLSLRAEHLFHGLELVDGAYQKAPLPVLWFVSSSGTLLGLTYVPEESVAAWHQHPTDGTFESVACVAEGQEDHVYVVVRRTIGGVQKRFVERMASHQVAAAADAVFVDSAVTYSGAATATITGLAHLEGKEVAILADGAVHARRTVSGGQVTLTKAASKVHVGLPFTSELVTLPMLIEIDAAGGGRPKNLAKAYVRVIESGRFLLGPADGRLDPSAPAGTAIASGQVEATLPGSWNLDGQLAVRQQDPLPLTVVAMVLEVAIGG